VARRREPEPWPGVTDSLPDNLRYILTEPAFSAEAVTYLIWRQHTDPRWSCGTITFPEGDVDPDGSAYQLRILDGNPKTYLTYAEEYFERALDLADIKAVYAHQLLTSALVQKISNGETDVKDIQADIEEIGYPICAS
jgi:hypothetical protein